MTTTPTASARKVMLRALTNFTRLDQTMPHEMVDEQLAALKAAGLVIVSEEPTEDTIAEAALSALTTESRVKRIWKIMLSAAQGGAANGE